jgi:opacity protein-like surface antigen
MRKMMLLALMLAMTLMAASPALADDWNDNEWNHRGWDGHHWNNWNDRNDWDDDSFFFGFPVVNVVEDVDFDNVRDRNSLEGECVADDVDLDGWIAEWEITCYV